MADIRIKECLHSSKKGDIVRIFGILEEINEDVASNGSSFVSGTLSDKGIRISFKIWDAKLTQMPVKAGDFVLCESKVDDYKGVLSLVVNPLPKGPGWRIRAVDEKDGVNRNEFELTAPIPPEEAVKEIVNRCKNVKEGPLKAFLREVWQQHRCFLCAAPYSAEAYNVRGGLLYVITQSLRVADIINPGLDNGVLLASAVVEHLGNRAAYEYGATGLITGDSADGLLVGKAGLGLVALEKVFNGLEETPAEVKRLMRHAVEVSYEPGLRKRPSTAETVALYYAERGVVASDDAGLLLEQTEVGETLRKKDLTVYKPELSGLYAAVSTEAPTDEVPTEVPAEAPAKA